MKYGFHQKKEPLTLFWRFGHRMGKNRHRTFGATTAGASLKSVSLSSSTSPRWMGTGCRSRAGGTTPIMWRRHLGRFTKWIGIESIINHGMHITYVAKNRIWLCHMVVTSRKTLNSGRFLDMLFSITQCVPFPILFRSTGTGGPRCRFVFHSPGTRGDHQGRTPLDPSNWCLEGISESLLHVLGWCLWDFDSTKNRFFYFFFHIFPSQWDIGELKNELILLNQITPICSMYAIFTNICPKITQM